MIQKGVHISHIDGFDEGQINIADRDAVKWFVRRCQIPMDLHKAKEHPQVKVVFVNGLAGVVADVFVII